ncbi:hypothetical protein HII13_002351 [Brettanomyces bruxellensis]|uniref:2'-phosphotransferase n=1 Tax=Dekkera bruxellensis TaxID=5007 RepID=A0A8H6BJC0_DEKBR|nr:hypothetical protein HII13_002351 [Brettanomyces bruxellensis]KAF6012688.1 hypothetical protein HII12_002210 [Brettanomyces bruxellensis]
MSLATSSAHPSKPRQVYHEPTGMHRLDILSRALSKLLRHQAGREHMNMDKRGFLSLCDVLNHRYFKSMKATPEDIFQAVNINDKKRFKIVQVQDDGIDYDNECKECEVHTYVQGCHYMICALQGHSIASVTDSYGMTEIKKNEYPEQIIHGTYYNKLKSIKESGGLSRMSRNHIHFAEGMPRYMNTGKRARETPCKENGKALESQDRAGVRKKRRASIISGMRKNCNVIISLDIEKVKKSDLVFYRSGNGVILCPGDKDGLVKLEYFGKVTDMSGKEIDLKTI